MASKNVFNNLNSIDTSSYLLDPSVAEVLEEDKSVKKNPDTTIEISKLISFKDHPFHVNTEDESFAQLVDSISENGVIYPIIIRPVIGENDKYEIIAGHCRVEACKQLGLDTIPARIQDMDDFLATIIMTHTNISGRDKISISEKAKAYRMCMDQERHQGINKGMETAEVIGAGKDSTRQVYRYVRLSYLIPEFSEILDSGRMAIQIAVEIAYISEEGQRALYKFCQEFKQYPSLDQAKELREKDAQKTLTYEMVIGHLVRPKKERKASKLTFKTKDISEFFEEDTEPEEMTNIIMRLLEKYKSGEYTI
ncbi:MAG: ParB/RepB/Spo0J family partition protein [Lachnospiraceae bacterium]|nr:ParB/RepB/Spo0J family partition protein [Lachnospiraceae bacterium]